jgi:GNAT superfamily N-acetyltransferase
VIEIELMTIADQRFVFECLKELRGSAAYDQAQFDEYVNKYGLIGHREFRILIGRRKGIPVAMLTCNRYAMPRYLGFGYELEEVVVHPDYQNQGFGKELIHAFFEWIKDDASARKLTVKTDDSVRAARVYGKYFDPVHTTVFAKQLRHL